MNPAEPTMSDRMAGSKKRAMGAPPGTTTSMGAPSLTADGSAPPAPKGPTLDEAKAAAQTLSEYFANASTEE